MSFIIGSDEVGYGSLIGSLIVCVVRAPLEWKIDGLNDSKQLKEKRRKELRDSLLKEAEKNNIQFYIAERTHTQIDEFGVYNALKDAHIEAVKKLYQEGDRIIVDGNLKFKGLGVDDLPIESIIKADTTIPQCMAASIIAKVYRDEIVIKLAEKYPQYGWEKNYGYFSYSHIDAIRKYGYTELHRKSYDPVKSMIKGK